MKREKHFMIDIETTGVNQETDEILEIGIVEIENVSMTNGAYWYLTGRQFHKVLHSNRQPESEFAKKHMTALYELCNDTPESENYEKARREIFQFIHPNDWNDEFKEHSEPKLFMGWNASNFDMPFMFNKGLLRPSYYTQVNGKETLCGDVHYRIYEQTGSVQLLSDVTGLDRKTIEVLAMDLNPTNIKLPEGKEHDALYDCYKQIIMQNGLIKIGRMNIRR